MRMRTVAWASLLVAITGCTESKSDEEKLKELVAAAPWMLEVLELCQAFDGTKGDADKKDISTTGLNLIRTSELKSARGAVARVGPVGEGDNPAEYSIQIKVSDKMEVASQTEKRPIKQGTPAYEIASKLKQGDCVTFSASNLDPIEQHQRGRVCDHRYYAQITELAPCE